MFDSYSITNKASVAFCREFHFKHMGLVLVGGRMNANFCPFFLNCWFSQSIFILAVKLADTILALVKMQTAPKMKVKVKNCAHSSEWPSCLCPNQTNQNPWWRNNSLDFVCPSSLCFSAAYSLSTCCCQSPCTPAAHPDDKQCRKRQKTQRADLRPAPK